ncbi:MAG: family 16 glycosylhydrolase [Bacteroidia bacterium]|nr:family 16 glycosylhydrolase [Bacteroidia bacterium]NNK90719.1 family 16 glycosylhydrolase [Saprospiraceae bacterium]
MRILTALLLFNVLFSCSSDGEEPMVIENVPPVFSMESITVEEGNQDKSVFVSLRLNKTWDKTVSATLKTVDGTAVAGEDFIAIDNELVDFDPGSRQENLRIQLLADEQWEEDEEFSIEIVSITEATTSANSATVTIENDDILGQFDLPDGYSTPETYQGMNLIWSDEFNGTELLQDDWTYEIGNGASGWGNNELQYYTGENTIFYEGHLVLQAREEFFGGFNYTSSRIITKDKFEFTHGRVDIRAVLPEGQGIWPALWMLGANISDVGWPRCGEIDIMELVGHEPGTVHGTVHYPDQGGNRIFTGNETSLSNNRKFSQDFHVFSVIWEEDRIKWLMDDKQFYQVSRTSLGSQNPYPFNEPFFFIFNIAVGGNWPGSPDSTTSFPQNMIIDYIRVFQEE